MAVDASPRIEHLFKGIGGQVKVFEYLSGSEEPEARAVIELRRRLSAKQAQSCPFEAYCVAAGVPVKKMFGIIAAEVSSQSGDAVRLMSKAAHPEVVQATIESAKKPFGVRDREMLHKAEGFVPVPKTAVTHFHGPVDARTQTQNVAVLPPVEDSVKRMSDRFSAGMAAVALPAVEQPEDWNDDDDEEDGE